MRRCINKFLMIVCPAALTILISIYLGSSKGGEIDIDLGSITSIAIAPGAKGIAIGVHGVGPEPDSPAEVRWWSWNGVDGTWQVPDARVGALAWDRDGSLLVGAGGTESRLPEVRWWRLSSVGVVLAECRSLPLGEDPARRDMIRRGVSGITALRDGEIVTGGGDSTLAVWQGCTPTWLDVETCCFDEHEIRVVARGSGFVSYGEGMWRNEELGYLTLGPRLWLPTPWHAVPVESSSLSPGIHAGGEDCSVTLDRDGQIMVSGAHPWSARAKTRPWSLLSVSRDCTAVIIADERGAFWTTAP